ncbi:predicted protein [Naegleria gruberi]|uniref:Predicted protein n=1 Tax=Naegleria gruberi TaxID=5762 RepID=D2UYE8_NAEGR|nr:uncharacterized protein NAEGRDRAFT_45159 [Naegleria gruberi]EFC50463.1 predicted protein [Naegleria gruberi]|eukprot:XP_002683207.1 predicted protein [Naegleria gruberi strain NEG-M]
MASNNNNCKFYSIISNNNLQSDKEDRDDDFMDDNLIEGFIVEYFDKSSKTIKLGLLDEHESVIYQENFTNVKNKDVVIIEKWSNMLTTLNDLREIREKANYMVLDETYQADFELRLENLLIEGFTSGKKFSSSTLSNELFEIQSMITRYIAFYLFENSGCFKYDTRSNKYIVIETDSSQIRVKDFIRRAKKRIQEINDLKQKNGQIENNSQLLNANLHTKWDPIIDVPLLRKMEFFILSNFLNSKNKTIIESILESFRYPKNRRGAAQFLHAVGHMHFEKSSNLMEESMDPDFENVKNLPSIVKPFPNQVESASQIMLKQVTSLIEKEKENISRRDLRKLKCIAIDDISTQAYDDAVSIEKTVNGYKIYIHVCDVSSFITKNDALETESRSRVKTIYGKNGVRLMLHPCAIRAITLSPERENLGFTLELSLIKSGSELKLDKYEFYKSILPKVEIFTYNTVDSLFNQFVKKKMGNKSTDMDQSHQLLIEMLHISINVDKSLNLGLISKTKSTPAHDTVAIIMSIANSVLAAHIKQVDIQNLFPQSNSYYRFTSPMRRYADLVTHIQYNSLLNNSKEPIYSDKEIKNICTEIQSFEKDILETQLMMDKKKRDLATSKNKNQSVNNSNQKQSNKVIGKVVKKRKGMSSVYIPSMDKTISLHLVEFDEVKMIELLSGILPETEKSSMDMLGWPALTKKMKENRSPNDIMEGSKVVLNIKHIEYYENDTYKPKVIVAEHCFEEKVDNYTI